MTCAGDEIGWDFVSLVKSYKFSFTAFCDEMTRKYKTNNILSPPFMSVKTFVYWLFSLMACMKIDFRKEVDPWCKYQPKVLAGDGTHVSVALQHLNLQHPVTTADIPESKVKPLYKRFCSTIIITTVPLLMLLLIPNSTLYYCLFMHFIFQI